MADVLRFAERVVDLAHGDPGMGKLAVGSPLAYAYVCRGTARWFLGRRSWREDYERAVAIARSADAYSYAVAVTYKYMLAISVGVSRADDAALHEITDATHIAAEQSGDDYGLSLIRLTRGLALLHRDSTDRQEGLDLVGRVRDFALSQRFTLTLMPVANAVIAWQEAKFTGRSDACPALRAAVDELYRTGQFGWCIAGTRYLVEALLGFGGASDVREAEIAIERLATAPADDGCVTCDIMLLLLRTLLAKAARDETLYRNYRDRHRALATSLGFEGHMKWAEAMP